MPAPAADSTGLDAVRRMADAVDEIVWIWDTGSGRVLHSNPAFARFFGSDAALASGRDVLLRQVDPSDADRVARLRQGLPAEPYSEEYRIVQPSIRGRKQRAVRLRETAFASAGPQGGAWVTHVLRDITWQFDTTAQLNAEITRRTDAERHLGDAMARLEAMLATANDPVVTIDEGSRIIDWNRAAERVFGWTREEAVGQVITELIVPQMHREHHHTGIRRFLADGTAAIFHKRVETRALRRSGEEFDVELSVWPVRTSSGYTFSSFVRDISRRKAAARALAESEAKYRQVVENVNEGILVTAGGRIRYANPKALALTGLDIDSATTRPFIEFIHPQDRERVLANHMRRLQGEQVENNYQFRVLHVDGSVRWLEISGVRFDWQGEPATLNFLVDVTQRRQAEEDMRSALARERELSELKSRFVAVASHELRTPLAGILSSVELLDSYGARLPAEERADLVAQVRSSVGRMNRLVEQVLLTSKLESGHFSFDPQPHGPADLLAQLAAEMDQTHAQAARIAMRCDGLPSPRMLDAQLVRHILVNLLSNALKYSPPDTPVECTAAADADDGVVFTVRDRGIGIPPGDLPRLFESFHRGANVGSVQGTGIGLHVVKECVQLHDGTVEVDSEPGRGTTFRVRLHAPVVL